MDAVELARRLAEVLRHRGQITDVQLQAAAGHFGAGENPVRCLELAGVSPAHLDSALAALGVRGSTAPTQVLGSVPAQAGEPTELLGTPRASPPPALTMQVAAPAPLPASTIVVPVPGGPAGGSRRIEAMPSTGEWLGQWRILHRLGEGGMASVSLAEDAHGRKAAVKVVHPHLLRMPELRARFLREIAATRKVQHKNVVGVLDMSASDHEQAWLAVEFVDGGNVGDLLRRHGRLPLAAAVELCAQLLEGLEAAHGMGIVHRDLKPENLLLTRDGVLKIADFGIARELDATQMTQTGSTLGTPSYMSPEQARAQPVDPRSDLYTTGVILYELLTGKNPFLADSIGATVANILLGRAPPLFEVDPTIPEAIDELVSALMRGDAATRPQSAALVRQALAPFVDEERGTRAHLLADLLADPGVATALRREQATSLVGAARQLLQMGPHQREAAGLCLMRARLLDEQNADAARLLQGLATEGVRFAATTNAKIVEVEQQLAASPEDPVLLQRAAQLWRQEGNVYKAAVYFRRYLKVRPDDQYVQGQLSRITMVAGSTVERIAGHVQTSLGVAAAVPIQRPPPEPAVRPPSGEEIRPPLGEGLVAALGMNAGKLVAGAIVVGLLAVGVPWLKDLTAARSVDGTRGGGAVRPGQPDEDQATKDLEDTRAAFQQGRWDDVIKAASAVLDHTSKPSRASEALVLRGRARVSANKQLAAVEDFSRVVNAYGDTGRAAEALVWRGKAYAESGDQDAAIADLTKALGKSLTQPLQVMARLERGLILAQRGDVDGARKDLGWVDNYTPPGDPAHGRAIEALRALP